MNIDHRIERKSLHRQAFEHYLRTGQRLTDAEWRGRAERKFNPYHDERGRFTSPPGVTVSWGRHAPGVPRLNEGYPAARGRTAASALRGQSRNTADAAPVPASTRTSDPASSKVTTPEAGFRSDFVRDAVQPRTSHAETSFELRRRQGYLDSLRQGAGQNPDPVVKADLDDFQRRIDADRARLDENVRRIVDPQTNEILRAGLAPADILFGGINIASGEGEARDYLSVGGALPVGAAIRHLGWVAKLPRVATVINGMPVEVVQLGGPHWKVRLLPRYHSHHIPSKKVSPLREGEGPAIAMLPEDHRKTLSYGTGPKQEAHRKAQEALIAKGDFRGAQQLDIDDIKRNFPGRYDDAIEQMLRAQDKGR